jgi:hypothetical protein
VCFWGEKGEEEDKEDKGARAEKKAATAVGGGAKTDDAPSIASLGVLKPRPTFL